MKRALQEPGAALALRARDGDVTVLAELFQLRMANWPHPILHDEFVTRGSFDDLIHGLDPAVAFRLIPAAAAIVLARQGSSIVSSALHLLLGLVRASDTTEMPAELEQRWNELGAIAGGDLAWRELRRWYRRNGDSR